MYESAQKKKSRSEVAAINAGVRKKKKELEERFPQLEKLVKKKASWLPESFLCSRRRAARI